MPKETVILREEEIVVTWGEVGDLVQIGIDRGKPFIFNDDEHVESYTSLWASLTVADIEQLEKVLRRVKRYKKKA